MHLLRSSKKIKIIGGKNKSCLPSSLETAALEGSDASLSTEQWLAPAQSGLQMPQKCSGELTCPLGVAGVCQERVSPGSWSLPPSLAPHVHPHATSCKAPERLSGTRHQPLHLFCPPTARSRPGLSPQPHQRSQCAPHGAWGRENPGLSCFPQALKHAAAKRRKAALLQGGPCILVPEPSRSQG